MADRMQRAMTVSRRTGLFGDHRRGSISRARGRFGGRWLGNQRSRSIDDAKCARGLYPIRR